MYQFYDYMGHNPVLNTNSVALFHIFSLALSLLLSFRALSISRSTVRPYICKITLSLSGTPDPLRALAWQYNIADTWKFQGHSIFHYFLYIQRHVKVTVAENCGESFGILARERTKNDILNVVSTMFSFNNAARVGIHDARTIICFENWLTARENV